MDKFLEYPNINFGKRYKVNTEGYIISMFNNKVMKFAFQNSSYRRVVLTDIYKKKHLLYVHRIIAYNFIPNPQNFKIVNHKDENTTNNDVSNLEWCNSSYNNTYNNAHKRRGFKLKGREPWNKGKTNVMSKSARQRISEARKKIGFVGNQYS